MKDHDLVAYLQPFFVTTTGPGGGHGGPGPAGRQNSRGPARGKLNVKLTWENVAAHFRRRQLASDNLKLQPDSEAWPDSPDSPAPAAESPPIGRPVPLYKPEYTPFLLMFLQMGRQKGVRLFDRRHPLVAALLVLCAGSATIMYAMLVAFSPKKNDCDA